MTEKEDMIIAKIGDREIKNSDFALFLQSLDPNVVRHFMNQPDGFKTILEEMINQEMMFDLAKEKNYESDEEFKKNLEFAKKDLLKAYAYNKIIGEVEKPSEEEIREYFEIHKDDLNKPFVNASHILVKTEEEAKNALKRLEHEEFEKVAEEISSCPSAKNGGNLGDFTKGQMVKEFDDAVFNMKEGEVSGPVKTQFGYHIIKLNKINSVQSPDFETAKDDIMIELQRQKQLEHYQKTMSDFKKDKNIQILV